MSSARSRELFFVVGLNILPLKKLQDAFILKKHMLRGGYTSIQFCTSNWSTSTNSFISQHAVNQDEDVVWDNSTFNVSPVNTVFRGCIPPPNHSSTTALSPGQALLHCWWTAQLSPRVMHLRGWSNTAKGCLESLGRYSNWTWSWTACSSSPCLSSRVGLNVLLPALRGLWSQIPVWFHNIKELVQGITLTREGRRTQCNPTSWQSSNP